MAPTSDYSHSDCLRDLSPGRLDPCSVHMPRTTAPMTRQPKALGRPGRRAPLPARTRPPALAALLVAVPAVVGSSAMNRGRGAGGAGEAAAGGGIGGGTGWADGGGSDCADGSRGVVYAHDVVSAGSGESVTGPGTPACFPDPQTATTTSAATAADRALAVAGGRDRPDHGERRGEHVEPGLRPPPTAPAAVPGSPRRRPGRRGRGHSSSSGMTSRPPSATVSASHR